MIGETIPIRLFLGGFDLTPTFRDVNKKFSTRYYLNLVLIDEENRRYFKQQEITVFRIPEVRVLTGPPAVPLRSFGALSDGVRLGLNRIDTIHLAGNGFSWIRRLCFGPYCTSSCLSYSVHMHSECPRPQPELERSKAKTRYTYIRALRGYRQATIQGPLAPSGT